MRKRLQSFYREHFLKEKIASQLLQNDILAAQYLQPLSKGYLPWSQSSLHPSGLVIILNEIVVNRRSVIIECGGGISTFFIARLLQERGGHLYTLESDKNWSGILRSELDKENLSHQVSIIDCPLVVTSLGMSAQDRWYDLSVIEKNLLSVLEQKVDFLIVDGPPAYQKETQYSRYPAVPFLQPFFAEDYTIVLDDIHRHGEQLIVAKWEQLLGIAFDQRFQDGNIAIGRSVASWTI
jgi:hypothetical protein